MFLKLLCESLLPDIFFNFQKMPETHPVPSFACLHAPARSREEGRKAAKGTRKGNGNPAYRRTRVAIKILR